MLFIIIVLDRNNRVSQGNFSDSASVEITEVAGQILSDDKRETFLFYNGQNNGNYYYYDCTGIT